ncbi:hypothetical protein HNP55_004692 [Paucibacter oligotrophus]|uniref:Uncharacterized protein n=1 Tax=Roseateles oligotrophus TaxID=1769250 RepID=A0A840LIV0_9BURK|nr:hypothetical protein [Roseateles oligotrophus]MBB4846138.1 hypothetical protein [Roseateles oligotrophus]
MSSKKAPTPVKKKSVPPALAGRLMAAGLKRVDVRELRRFRLLYTVYPQIRETVTPELIASLEVGGFITQVGWELAP